MIFKSGPETKDNNDKELFSDDKDTLRIHESTSETMISLKSLTNPYSQPFDLSNQVSSSLFKKATK